MIAIFDALNICRFVTDHEPEQNALTELKLVMMQKLKYIKALLKLKYIFAVLC